MRTGWRRLVWLGLAAMVVSAFRWLPRLAGSVDTGEAALASTIDDASTTVTRLCFAGVCLYRAVGGVASTIVLVALCSDRSLRFTLAGRFTAVTGGTSSVSAATLSSVELLVATVGL